MMESFTPVVQSTIIEPCRASTLNTNLFKNIIPPPPKEEKLASYLRIRPIPGLSDPPFRVEGQYLYAKPPKASKAYKALKDGDTGQRCYSFNHIFDEKTTQDEFYQGTTRPLVDRFMKGESSLLFAYGTTNSGKSFTMKGNDEQLGVIPRALNEIFEILGDRISTQPLYKPGNRGFAEADPILENSLKRDKEIAKFIFSTVKNSNSTLNSFHTLSRSTIESIDLTNYDYSGTKFCVWVSFLEFYMDNLKDLLAVEEKGKKPDQLLLAADANENYFVKGLRHVPVTSADEAIKCLVYGWESLHRAATQLNHDSSRSHCVFTISLISYESSPHNPCVRFVSSLSFCDLAGSERGARTGNTGERLREAAKINNSLMVLNRCVTALRSNQKKDGRLVIPFRESPLTKFFKSYFGGTGFATMIININPSIEYYDETLISLQFSTEASDITVNSREVRERFKNSVNRLTQQWMQSSERWSNFAPPNENHISTIINDDEDGDDECSQEEFDDKTLEYLNALQQSCLDNDDPDTLKLLAQYIERINEEFEREKLGWEVTIRKEVASEIEDLYRQKTKEHEKKIHDLKRDHEQEEKKTREWYRERIRQLKLESAHQVNQLHRQIEEKDKLLSQREEEIRKMREQNETINSHLTDLETTKEVNLQQIRQEHENHLNHLQQELDKNKQQLEEISLLKEQLMNSQKELQNLKDEKSKLEAHLADVENEKSKFNDVELKLTEKVTQLVEEAKLSSDETNGLKEQLTQLESKVLELKQENEHFTAQVAKLTNELVKCKGENCELTRQNRQNVKIIEMKDKLLEANETELIELRKEIAEIRKQQQKPLANAKPTVILGDVPPTESTSLEDDVKIVSRKNCKRKQAPVTVDPYLQALKKNEIEATPKPKRVKEDEDDSNITEDESDEDEISTRNHDQKTHGRNLRPRTFKLKNEESARKKLTNANGKSLQSPSPVSSQEVEQETYLPPTGRKTRAKRANTGQKNVKKSLF